jgi:hypothetical protein
MRVSTYGMLSFSTGRWVPGGRCPGPTGINNPVEKAAGPECPLEHELHVSLQALLLELSRLEAVPASVAPGEAR